MGGALVRGRWLQRFSIADEAAPTSRRNVSTLGEIFAYSKEEHLCVLRGTALLGLVWRGPCVKDGSEHIPFSRSQHETFASSVAGRTGMLSRLIDCPE